MSLKESLVSPKFFYKRIGILTMKMLAAPILLVTILSVSGMALAQTNDTKSGTQGGAGPTGSSGLGDNGKSVRSRTAVKAEANTSHNKSGTMGGEGSNPDTNANTTKSPSDGNVSKSRAAVKAEANTSHNKSGTMGGSGSTPDAGSNAAVKGGQK